MSAPKKEAPALEQMSDDALLDEAVGSIGNAAWAHATNTDRGEQARTDAIYAECHRRGRVDIYERAHKFAMRQAGVTS